MMVPGFFDRKARLPLLSPSWMRWLVSLFRILLDSQPMLWQVSVTVSDTSSALRERPMSR